MRRFWIAGLLVLAMMLPALPAAAKKPIKPPAAPVLFDVTLEFDGVEGLSTMADPSCGPADVITMELDRNYLVATDDEAGVPMIDVNLGPELAWYRDYPYFASPADVPANFDPAEYPYDQELTGDGIIGCHGAGIMVYADYYRHFPDDPGPATPDLRIGDHLVNWNAGLFRLKVSDGAVELLWHSDYYIQFEKVRKRWVADIAEDFTYSGGFTWTTVSGEPVPWDPAVGASGVVSGELHTSYYWLGYTPFIGSPRDVQFILTVTPKA